VGFELTAVKDKWIRDSEIMYNNTLFIEGSE
jgi:hypothetical protein